MTPDDHPGGSLMEQSIVHAINRLIVGATNPPLIGEPVYEAFARVLPVRTIELRGVSIRICCPLNDVTPYKYSMNWACQEPEVLDWIDRFHSDAVFFDVGASFGNETLYAALKENGPTSTFSLECEYWASINLATNLMLNRITNVSNIFSVVGDTTGYTRICERVRYVHPLHMTEKYNDAYKVAPVTTLDKISEDFGVEPEYVKIDVDGPEVQVIRGMRKICHGDSLKSIYVEVNSDEAYDAITGFLNDHGFQEEAHARSGNSGNKNKIFTR